MGSSKRRGLSYTQKLIQDISTEIGWNGTNFVGQKRNVVEITTNPGSGETVQYNLTDAESGTLFYINPTGTPEGQLAMIIPEPTAANAGWFCEVVLAKSWTGANGFLGIGRPATSPTLIGNVWVSEAGSTTDTEKVLFSAGPDSSKTLLFCGGPTGVDTSGRLQGGTLRVTLLDTGLWMATGRLVSSGNATTPFF